MRHYELMFVADPSTEEVQDEIKKRLEGIITGREGVVISFEKLGKKRLAYPIAKNQYGVYYLVNLKGDGKIIQALDYFMRLNPNIIRHIVLSFSDKQLRLKERTDHIQAEEAERMRLGGRPLHSAEETVAAVAPVVETVATIAPVVETVSIEALAPSVVAEGGAPEMDKSPAEAATAPEPVAQINPTDV